MPLNLFVIGLSGCGKSTQAKRIADRYSLKYFSFGQLLRDEAQTSSKLGLEAKGYLDSGNLVPDDVAFAILITALQSIDNQNFVIDGFPRRLDQAIYVEKYLANKGKSITAIIHLDITSQEVVARRQKAGSDFQKEDKDRTDNTPEAIASRQKFYDDNNQPVMDYFQAKGLLFRVDASRAVEPIFSDLSTYIDSLLDKTSIINPQI